MRGEGAKGAENNDELLVIPTRSEESLGSNYQLSIINEVDGLLCVMESGF